VSGVKTDPIAASMKHKKLVDMHAEVVKTVTEAKRALRAAEEREEILQAKVDKALEAVMNFNAAKANLPAVEAEMLSKSFG
jgi:cell division septum initiation protein DivIVA